MSFGLQTVHDPRVGRFDPADIFAFWDLGKSRHRIDWVLDVLMASVAGIDWDTLCAMPVGRRDGLLLALRAKSFGNRVDLFAACPNCGERVEFSLDVTDLIIADPFDWPTGSTPGILTSTDLARALAGSHLAALDDTAKISVLAADLRRFADPLGLSEEELETALSTNDPMAILSFPMTCPACTVSWSPVLDVPELLWSDVVAEGKRALADVHDLARAYGWNETTILAMNADRRREYIDLIHR